MAFCQRRVRMLNAMVDDSDASVETVRIGELSGSEYFQLEHFGMSALEVLKVICSSNIF